MVDKGTARALVYGALGTLALILVIAIYAIATKSSVQAELDQQLEALQAKDVKLKQEAQRRAQAMAKFDEAQEAMVKKEEENKVSSVGGICFGWSLRARSHANAGVQGAA